MTTLEALRFATRALSGHGLRTGLSMLGVSIGVGSVVMLTTLGEGARRYVYMEVGHSAQNVHLQAVALDLATVVVGALDEARVKSLLNLAGDEVPQVVMPVGHPVRRSRRKTSR